jgi:predicted nuclease of restriction endonuclease-like (RecB) superfamily
MSTSVSQSDYLAFLSSLKERVHRARMSAGRAVNNELILLYWDIGQGIVEKQRTSGWGDSVIDQISRDLQKAFPGTSGFSPRNLRSIRQFYSAYSDPSFWLQVVAKLPALKETGKSWLQPAAKLESDGNRAQFLRQLVAEIPWGQHLLILNKIIDPTSRLYYIRATTQFGWSRNVLLNQIKAGAYERAVKDKKTHNFALALPEQLAEQADEMIKSSPPCLTLAAVYSGTRLRLLFHRAPTPPCPWQQRIFCGFAFLSSIPQGARGL